MEDIKKLIDKVRYFEENLGMFFEAPLNPNWINNYHRTGELPKFKYDGTIRSSRVDGGKSITVRNPEQIHILGSKEDIEGFTQYTKK